MVSTPRGRADTRQARGRAAKGCRVGGRTGTGCSRAGTGSRSRARASTGTAAAAAAAAAAASRAAACGRGARDALADGGDAPRELPT